MGWIITDKVTGCSYDTDHDGYPAVAEALHEHPERFTDATSEEKRRIREGAEILGWRPRY